MSTVHVQYSVQVHVHVQCTMHEALLYRDLGSSDVPSGIVGQHTGRIPGESQNFEDDW